MRVARRAGPRQPRATPRPSTTLCVRVDRAPQRAYYGWTALKRVVFEPRSDSQTLTIGEVSRAPAGR